MRTRTTKVDETVNACLSRLDANIDRIVSIETKLEQLFTQLANFNTKTLTKHLSPASSHSSSTSKKYSCIGCGEPRHFQRGCGKGKPKEKRVSFKEELLDLRGLTEKVSSNNVECRR